MRNLVIALMALGPVSAFAQNSRSLLENLVSNKWERARVITSERYSLEDQKFVQDSSFSVSHQFDIEWDGKYVILSNRSNSLTGYMRDKYDSRQMGAKIKLTESLDSAGKETLTFCTNGKGPYANRIYNLFNLNPLNEQFYLMPDTDDGNDSFSTIKPVYLAISSDCVSFKATESSNEIELISSLGGKIVYQGIYKKVLKTIR